MRRWNLLALLSWIFLAAAAEIPPNQWVQLARDANGARRGSALRYAPASGTFLLWGFMDHDPELPQEHPLMQIPEYDMVAFSTVEGRWRNHLPPGREIEWSRQLPMAFLPRTYSAITTGSERTVLRGAADERGGVPRPDLNIVFDQVAWHEPLQSLVYFTGGLTAAYDPVKRFWTDLRPIHTPPPVAGGSLVYDSTNGEMLLFGGGHVAERGPGGKVAGYTGTWALRDRDWRRVSGAVQPPPRTNTRMMEDPRERVVVLFGGDGQSHYLGDTWLYDLKTRTWRASKAREGPPPRAGHFTVYDPATGWVLIGGGYNRRDLTDMWAYDAAADQWFELKAQVPTGFYISADLAPGQNLILLTANTRRPGDLMTCNVLYPVRTTFGFRIDAESLRRHARPASQVHSAMVRRDPLPQAAGKPVSLDTLPQNQWVLLSGRNQGAPVRTWGTATFDSARGEILYWGGGHCGYGGSDVDAFDPRTGQWRAADAAPEFPMRAWDKGVRLAGVTFQGAPWTDHGRRIYAYDPVRRKMIMVRTIRSTTGYDPELLNAYPAKRSAAPDAIVTTPSSYNRFATYAYDTQSGQWEMVGPAPLGVDTLVTTPRGVMAVNVDWPSRLNDAGYMLPWSSRQAPADTGLYLLDAASSRWIRLGAKGPSPQNLYEMTSLAYDTRRNRLLLHGAGAQRNELWSFDTASGRWIHLSPPGPQPDASREAVYLPKQDVVLLCSARELWEYSPGKNRWRLLAIAFASSGQNRAMVYDAKRDLVLLVLGANEGGAAVYAMRYFSEP
jgi:hypothetical protein